MTLEDVISDVAKAGWMVSNLFQLERDRWRCNLYKWEKAGNGQDYFCEFADADTPEWAMALALQKANTDPKPYRGLAGKVRVAVTGELAGVPEKVIELYLMALDANMRARQCS